MKNVDRYIHHGLHYVMQYILKRYRNVFLKCGQVNTIFYIRFFNLLISIDTFLLSLEIIFEVLVVGLSVMKLKSLHTNKKI